MQQIEKVEDAWNLVSRFYQAVALRPHYGRGLSDAVSQLSLELGVSFRHADDPDPSGICILLELLAAADVISYEMFRSMGETLESAFPGYVGRHIWPQTPRGAQERALWAKLQATKAVFKA